MFCVLKLLRTHCPVTTASVSNIAASSTYWCSGEVGNVFVLHVGALIEVKTG